MLFESFSLKDLKLKNRIIMPPMCNYSSDREGLANDWHLVHYASRAIGGTALIIQEATGIEDGGRITARDLGIWNDEQAEGLKRLVDIVHKHGSMVGIQLNHAGPKSEVEYLEPVAPSPIAFSEKHRVPRELTKGDIALIIDRFAVAAKRAVAVGYDAIEIHAAHGYLLSQFLSPVRNMRRDEYGGEPANRVRLLGEVTTAVRSVIPRGMPLIVRVSAHDYDKEGNTAGGMAEMINLVKDKGIDVVHVSSGGVTPTAPRAYPGYQIPFALQIKDRVGLPVIGGGLISEALQANQVVKAGVDMVFLGRELLRNPYWPLQAAFALSQEATWPEPYIRAKYL